MRTITSACFGFALALSAVALASAPTSAMETSAVSSAVSSDITKVDWRSHCDRWRVRCRQLYPAGGWRFRRCLAIHACHR
jgi:hypothetical protein